MYNLHAHSLLSDGCLLPSELAMRYLAAGYKAVAITDHVDHSNIKQVIAAITAFTRHWPKRSAIRVLPGIELTHLPPEQFKPLVAYARKKGIKVIVGHGESPVEPVAKGTNRAALESGIDILAHPGYLSDSDARLASRKKVFLEITSRSGHNRTNAFVAKKALKFGCRLILNHDSHDPEDILSPAAFKKVGLKAGLSAGQVDRIFKDIESFVKSK
ncbi:MAG: histidinol phosphate phosphatase domain-containing protein [Candidatus Omnitrophica bacterium]|nr:histidinol phosphate phosphatase domain-containing protein [Candidatus Omnitrophota bacterium]